MKNSTETVAVKLDYKALVSEAKGLGLDTKGKAADIAARIAEYKASQPKVERRGRPVNPNSARQARLSIVGTGRRGRPVDPTSAWNIKQAALQAKREAGELKLGRAINPNSARQKRLALKGTLPLGRPKAKVDVVEVPVVDEASTTSAE